MSYEQAIAALDSQYAAGDVTDEQYREERERLDYEHGKQRCALEDRRVVA
ncbi:hypothetical protein ACFQH5_20470 [Halomonas salifodinae]|uniref:SHOCT domain-containing protein n=1 Tax=Halomonas salifodinae TaxID=438745 RepID=A0ABW2F114_9GAMM